ncbi:MAG: hypothetical protein HY706_01220, partial [Candidatus Hydrogenedentes bacterium]|nr:hypothetical protein [Candidatus Hydrogenedentota bacterium]
MNTKRQATFRKLGIPSIFVTALVVGAIIGSACWKKKEEPASAPAPEAQAPEPLKPATLKVLQFWPESAAMAMAIPSFAAVHDKSLALAKRCALEGQDVDAA